MGATRQQQQDDCLRVDNIFINPGVTLSATLHSSMYESSETECFTAVLMSGQQHHVIGEF